MLRPQKRQLVVGLLGLCLITFGIAYTGFSEPIFNALLERLLVLRPNSLIYQWWQSPPLNASFDIYLYNWTNPQDIRNLSTKPILEEVGPYRYTEISRKKDMQWHPENASLTYRKENHYYFDPVASKGTPHDRIVTFNTIGVGVAAKSKQFGLMRRTLTEMALKMYGYKAEIERKPGELLFEGYSDPLVDIVNIIPSSWSNVNIPLKKFGYAHGRNGSSPFYGFLNIHTGADDISKLGQIHSWNNYTTNPYYASKCAKVHGSPGEFHPPHLQKHRNFDLFVPDICRHITFEYVGTETVDGILGYRYETRLRSIDNGTLYPENACYCNGDCVPLGVINVTNCMFDVPAFISYPHFYLADPYYAAQVIGQNPQAEKHRMWIVLEPRTGVLLDLVARLQINLLTEPVPHISMMHNIPKMYFPLMWFEMRMHITPQMVNYLSWFPPIILSGQVFGVLCAIIGAALLLRSLFGHLIQQHAPRQLDNGFPTDAQRPKGTKDVPEISPLLPSTSKTILLTPDSCHTRRQETDDAAKALESQLEAMR